MNDESMRVLREMHAPQGFLYGVLRRVGLLDAYALVASPVGEVYVAAGDAGVTAVMPAQDAATFEARYRARFGRRAERRDELAAQFEKAIAQGRTADVDLRECTPFQRAVLEATRRIAPGTVRPYAWIAREIGHPRAVRAVGTALANNPVPLVVPCHRVVRSDGQLGEYALGGGRKIDVLEGEGVDPDEVRRRMRTREFWGEEGEPSYCYPYCFPAHRLPERKLIGFSSVREAQEHGLTPCKTCHPPLAA